MTNTCNQHFYPHETRNILCRLINGNCKVNKKKKMKSSTRPNKYHRERVYKVLGYNLEMYFHASLINFTRDRFKPAKKKCVIIQ